MTKSTKFAIWYDNGKQYCCQYCYGANYIAALAKFIKHVDHTGMRVDEILAIEEI